MKERRRGGWRTNTAKGYESRLRKERRERFERQLAEGSLTVRYVCPRCGGGHHVRDCRRGV